MNAVEIMKKFREEEIQNLKLEKSALLAALKKTEDERDRYFSQKQYLAGEHMRERDVRQKAIAALHKIFSEAGKMPESEGYEESMIEIHAICSEFFEMDR